MSDYNPMSDFQKLDAAGILLKLAHEEIDALRARCSELEADAECARDMSEWEERDARIVSAELSHFTPRKRTIHLSYKR